MVVRCTPVLGLLEQKVRGPGGLGLLRYLYHDYHHHPIHAGRLECSCRRLSGDAGQRRFPYEGSSSLRRVSLFAQAGCRESVALHRNRLEHIRTAKNKTPHKVVWKTLLQPSYLRSKTRKDANEYRKRS